VLLVWQGDGRNRFITVLFYLSDVDEGSPFAFWPVCPSVCPCSYGCIFVRVSVRTYMRTCKVCTIYHMPIRVRIRTSTAPISRARTQARALFLSRSHDTCMCAHAHTRTRAQRRNLLPDGGRPAASAFLQRLWPRPACPSHRRSSTRSLASLLLCASCVRQFPSLALPLYLLTHQDEVLYVETPKQARPALCGSSGRLGHGAPAPPPCPFRI